MTTDTAFNPVLIDSVCKVANKLARQDRKNARVITEYHTTLVLESLALIREEIHKVSEETTNRIPV